MKTNEELKAELHKKIESIDDAHILTLLNEDIMPYAIENRTKEMDEEDDDLTIEQEKELDEAIRQADNGETVCWEEFLNSTQ